jgi:DNA (cytosine-5)-methyltransferase 1
MAAFYNEIDPYAAQWLRNLIDAGHIAPGVVDERDIRDIRPEELHPYNQCHFFAGIGVWSCTLRSAGWADDRPVWTGSCPCQPFSAAGAGGGFADERHLWPHFHWLISQCRPPVVLGEQVASKDGLGWLDLVQTDMEGSGYAFGANDLCAAGIGAPHIRQRLWFVGLADAHDARSQGRGRMPECTDQRVAGAHSLVDGERRSSPTDGFWRDADWLFCRDGKWRPVEPGTFPLAHGATARVGRLRAYGNAIVAPLAQTFVETVMECL